ncbi:hypothetical protein MKK75_01790 [Methylobacterium sp. J-030]|uniref:hypothetical protein n=1 Tax=Methylobacterium sp. J-030 TaxID=2836627 RepID=UPI001FB97833|nr:hypothetical protein [Methylobacterium sp. J-030]MCJ2067544.1 hypothetical protein [Methylobacterium sp. J-030]
MPHGARTRLTALILLLGIGSATAEPAPGTTWTDPPAHKPSAEAPDRKAAAPASTPSAPSTPAAVAEEARPVPAVRRATARRAPVRTAARRAAPKRVAATAHRSHFAAAPPPVIAGPRVAPGAPPPPPGRYGYARYRPYGYGPGYGPGYADERLDRLSSAEAAGYLVVHRRTVMFPDGRTLRVYRPDDGEPF